MTQSALVFGIVLCFSVVVSLSQFCLDMLVLSVSLSVIAEALTLLEDSRTGVWDRPGCEGDRWCRTTTVRALWFTASPEWGSRCKALIAPRSLSLLCDRPPQSCHPPPQL